jgi:hypothetical protein
MLATCPFDFKFVTKETFITSVRSRISNHGLLYFLMFFFIYFRLPGQGCRVFGVGVDFRLYLSVVVFVIVSSADCR